MKKRIALLTLASCLLLSPLMMARAAEVVQGKCLEVDLAAHLLVIEEYDINFNKDHPYGHGTGVVSSFDIARAKLGLPPECGDILRIAYDLTGSGKVAVKVMNVSKQNRRK